jgi:hypothetical protein
MRTRKLRETPKKGDRVFYPPYSVSRYMDVCRITESGTFALLESGAYQFWAPVATLRERWGSE